MFGVSFFSDPSAKEESKQLINEAQDKLIANTSNCQSDSDNVTHIINVDNYNVDDDETLTEVLVFGYLRVMIRDENYVVPIDIIHLTIKYYHSHITNIIVAPIMWYSVCNPDAPSMCFSAKSYYTIGTIKNKIYAHMFGKEPDYDDLDKSDSNDSNDSNYSIGELVLYKQETVIENGLTLIDCAVKDGETIKYSFVETENVYNPYNQKRDIQIKVQIKVKYDACSWSTIKTIPIWFDDSIRCLGHLCAKECGIIWYESRVQIDIFKLNGNEEKLNETCTISHYSIRNGDSLVCVIDELPPNSPSYGCRCGGDVCLCTC
eukprot:437048_1